VILHHSKTPDYPLGKEEEILDEVQEIRKQNNVNWMGLIRLALHHAPKEARRLITEVNKRDAEVTNKMEKLIK
ncbi:unnamed protein product, partial [marine sediment metagenome]